jgi:hypothetical protein
MKLSVLFVILQDNRCQMSTMTVETGVLTPYSEEHKSR